MNYISFPDTPGFTLTVVDNMIKAADLVSCVTGRDIKGANKWLRGLEPDSFSFVCKTLPGPGNRNIKFISPDNAAQLLYHLPGTQAKKIRSQCARSILGYFGCDVRLVEQLEANGIHGLLDNGSAQVPSALTFALAPVAAAAAPAPAPAPAPAVEEPAPAVEEPAPAEDAADDHAYDTVTESDPDEEEDVEYERNMNKRKRENEMAWKEAKVKKETALANKLDAEAYVLRTKVDAEAHELITKVDAEAHELRTKVDAEAHALRTKVDADSYVARSNADSKKMHSFAAVLGNFNESFRNPALPDLQRKLVTDLFQNIVDSTRPIPPIPPAAVADIPVARGVYPNPAPAPPASAPAAPVDPPEAPVDDENLNDTVVDQNAQLKIGTVAFDVMKKTVHNTVLQQIGVVLRKAYTQKYNTYPPKVQHKESGNFQYLYTYKDEDLITEAVKKVCLSQG